MSWYYSYYVGLRNKKTKKIDLLGPFDNKGYIHPVIEKSRNFATDLHTEFTPIEVDALTDSAKKSLDKIGYEEPILSYLLYEEIGEVNPVEKGYFLTEDIDRYEKTGWTEPDMFLIKLTPESYLRQLENELKLGVVYEEDEYTCSDFAYYAYVDFSGKEYEKFLLKNTMHMMISQFEIPEDCERVILCTQG